MLAIILISIADASGINCLILNQFVQVVDDLPGQRENIDARMEALRTPDKILIGVWGFSGDTELALRPFLPTAPDKFVVSLKAALEYLGVAAPPTKLGVSGEPIVPRPPPSESGIT